MYSNESKGGKFPTMAPKSSWVITDAVIDKDSYSKCGYNNPSTSGGDAEFIFEGPAVFPEYLSDVNVLVCPSDASGGTDYWVGVDPLSDATAVDPCALTAESYMYLGWALNGAPGKDYLKEGADPNNPTGDPLAAIDVGFMTRIIALLNEQAAATLGLNKYDGDVEFTNDATAEITIYRLREGIERFFITDINNPAASAQAQSEIPVMFDMASSTVGEFNHIPGGENVLYMDGHVEFLKFPGDFPATRAFVSLVSLF